MLILAVDLETSGPCVKANFPIELGAVLVDADVYDPCVPEASVVARFSSYVRRPPGFVFDDRCLTEFWMNPKCVAVDRWLAAQAAIASPATPTEQEVGAAFVAWLVANRCRHGDRRFALTTDNPAFDFCWLQRMLPPGVPLLYLSGKYDVDPVDTNSFYAGLLRRPLNADTSVSKSMRDHFRDVPRGTEHAACDDAAHMAMCLAHATSAVVF